MTRAALRTPIATLRKMDVAALYAELKVAADEDDRNQYRKIRSVIVARMDGAAA